jgi:hypothetical protein
MPLATLPLLATNVAADEQQDVCFRCGYDLRGFSDDAPCPECGLLAGRSRMPTEELKHARPRWIGKLSVGVWLIILAQILSIFWFILAPVLLRPLAYAYAYSPPLVLGLTVWELTEHGHFAVFHLAALMFFCGTVFVTWPEGRPEVDRFDRRRRGAIRVFAFLLTVLIGLAHWHYWNRRQSIWWSGDFFDRYSLLAISVIVPLPLLLFRQLRHLAQRVLSAHLAEHCVIVGWGMSATLLLGPLMIVLTEELVRADVLSRYWATRSLASLVLMLLIQVAVGLFYLWTLYISICFAAAFWRAREQAIAMWKRADRSVGE